MSWLRPDNISPSDYDPQRKVTAMVEKHGPFSQRILEAFNEADPLNVVYGNNPDEYVGYVNRFFERLGDRNFSALTDQEVRTVVTGSFHASQIEQGFSDPKGIDMLVQKIVDLQEPDS